MFTLKSQHVCVRKALKLPQDFVIHSLSHTFGSRLGESGAGAFQIMRILGHSSIAVSQRYVHPTPEGLERTFERLEALNACNAASALREASTVLEVPTILTTMVGVRNMVGR